MKQLDWILAQPFAAPAPRISRQNDHGVLETIEMLELCGGSYQSAKIRLAFDGRIYHWGIHVYGIGGGFGFAPSPKWSRSAATRDQAMLDAAAEMREGLAALIEEEQLGLAVYGKDMQYRVPRFARQIFTWLDNILEAPITQDPAPWPWSD